MSNGDHPVQPADQTPTPDAAASHSETEPTESTPTQPNSSESAESGQPPAASQPAAKPAGPKVPRGSGPLAARGLGVAKPSSPTVDTQKLAAAAEKSDRQKSQPKPKPKPSSKAPRPRLAGESDKDVKAAQPERPRDSGSRGPVSKVAVPNRRHALSDDLQAELEAELAAADVEAMLSGPAGLPDRKEPLAEGAQVSGTVLKIHADNVFVHLGGPDEGVVPFEQFEQEPAVGSQLDVVVRGVSREDGLYQLSLPGGTIEVSDWEDLEEGSVVEATVTGSNSGGLECKVGGVKGFIPISQITEYRIEDTSEFVDQKLVCLVTEANARRGNLVLSRRAVLEREREAKRKEQLEQIEPGDQLEGTVRSIKDFGAFVDLGGLDGLIHISKLSWDRVKHPSEVLQEGQKVQVVIEKVDKETGKISLSYRDLLENPWDTAEAEFQPGSVHRGTVSKIANFGCFVRLAAGVEGLVHISEVANHRVSKVDAFVSEGQEVEVKVLSFDRDSQKISLSIKQAQAPAVEATTASEEETESNEPPYEPAVKPQHTGPLKGGNNRDTGGERFGLRW